MSAVVSCPRCGVSCAVPPEHLGRTGRCQKCGLRIRLATPVAEALEPIAHPPAPVPEAQPVLEAEPVPDPPPPVLQPVLKPVAEEHWPDTPVLLDAPADPPRPKGKSRAAREKSDQSEEPERGPSGPAVWLLVLLAVAGLSVGGASGALLVKRLAPAKPAPERPVADTPRPAPAEPDPKPPAPKPADPVEPGPKPEPPPEKNTLKLAEPVATVTAGAGGRVVVFQLAKSGDLVFYDTKRAAVTGTISGAPPNAILTASRDKLFVGRRENGRIDRFDLRTGKGEGSATLKGATASLVSLVCGPASDGPLLAVTYNPATNQYLIRLLDPETFAERRDRLDAPTLKTNPAFPLNATALPPHAAVSADGRALTLGGIYFLRTDDGFRGARVSTPGNFVPAPDGQWFLGAPPCGLDGRPIATDLDPDGARKFIPAATGPFVVSALYPLKEPLTVQLRLHFGPERKPLGPLPGGEAVAEWAKMDSAWAADLHRRLVFVPDPGLVIFAPQVSDRVHVIPVDVPALLAGASRGVTFTTVAPAEARAGRAYVYQAVAVSPHGTVRFSLEKGPPEMTVTPAGRVSWARPELPAGGTEVKLVATDEKGNQAVQSFRLFLRQNEEPPKK